MTRDDIIRMAENCGIPEYENNESQAENILRFAALVAAAEREAIWQILFDYAGRDDLSLDDESLLKHLADLIRARTMALDSGALTSDPGPLRQRGTK